MKICSFLPGATSMIYHMEIEEDLCGVTFECPSDKPKVVRSILEGCTYRSEEIERVVSQAKAEGRSLYYIDEELLTSISPDVIITQDVCDVCQIDTSYVQRAVSKFAKQPRLVSLIPRNLEDVYRNAITIAATVGKEEAAHRLLAQLRKRTDSILGTLRKYDAPLRRVMVMEWLDPIYNCGHWIPYQIAQAGGVDLLSNPSGHSVITSWKRVLQYDPEVLVIAPCGFHVERTLLEINTLMAQPGWNDLSAVKHSSAYIVDAELLTQPSTRLVDGIELLAALFHPELFHAPDSLRTRYLSLNRPETTGLWEHRRRPIS